MAPHFSWTAFDVTSLLPQDWPDDIKKVAAEADFHDFPRTRFLSREAEHVEFVSRGRVHAGRSGYACPGYTGSTAAISSTWPGRPGGNRSRRPMMTGTASS